MKRRYRSPAASFIFTLCLGSCTDRDARSDSTKAVNAGEPKASAVTDAWLGQWTGPEGTFLRLEGGKGKYDITIQDLDGPRTYQGAAAGPQIQFERNGEKESIRATNGAETGMKWLRDKSDCLTIRTGEGYCRD
jgi:hypothetical protein